MTVKEFDLLALDSHNYPTWPVDVKVSLASCGLYRAVLPPEEGVAPLEDQHVYTALYLDGVALDSPISLRNLERDFVLYPCMLMI